MKLKDRVAIITGGGTGIGRAIAHAFVSESATVVVASRSLSNLNEVVKEIEAEGGKAKALQTDISSEDQVKRMVASTIDEFGRIDILVNNSAATQRVPVNLVDMELDDWKNVLAVNLNGTMLCCREALRVMIPRKSGNIINISSIAGVTGHATQSAYGTSKWGIIGLTETLAIEAGEHNIRVNSISPAATNSAPLQGMIKYLASSMGISYDDFMYKVTRHYSLKRIAEPSEIAAAALFLASDDSSAMTGQNLVVSCGYHMMQPDEIE
ncbi:MAG: SDR family NAD(P)-dependent oxidoreductase [Dehalococcoidia bacterium]